MMLTEKGFCENTCASYKNRREKEMSSLPPTVRGLVESGENLEPYFTSTARRKNVRRATGAYTLTNVTETRTRKRVLGEGTFGKVALDKFSGVAGPRVAVKIALEEDNLESICAETAALRYCTGLPNIAQLIGVVSTAAAGNTNSTALPRIMMAPAKSSLANLLKGPSAKSPTRDIAKETELRTEWDDLYPYTVEADVYIPAFDSEVASARRAGWEARVAAASATSKGMNASRPLLARSWSNIKSICLQILRGYHVLHSWGLVHRDTKPENMLVTPYGEVQITDFGVSRYHTKYLEPVQDSYTGTIWYASPEVLMAEWLRRESPPPRIRINFTEEEWKKHDAWAVGATLYHVLTRDTPFVGYTRAEMLDRIFAVKGAPVEADGSIFENYTKLPDTVVESIKDYARDPDAIIKRILTRCIVISPDFDPANTRKSSELLQLARIVQGLLELNPERRLSIEEALAKPLFGGAPTMPPRPFISTPFSFEKIDTSGLADASKIINDRMCEILNPWLMQVTTQKIKRESAPFVLDRAITYYKRFYQYYTTVGKPKMLLAQSSGTKYLDRAKFQAIGIIAFLIASHLFNSAYVNEVDIEYAHYITDRSQEKKVFKNIFNLFVEAEIPFYGRTYFDELLAADPVLPTLADPLPRIYALGVLNAICHGTFYYQFKDHLPLLFRFMSEYATENAALGFYFARGYDTWDKSPLNPEIKNFMGPLGSIVEAAKANKSYLVEYFLSRERPTTAVLDFARSADCPPGIRDLILAAAGAATGTAARSKTPPRRARSPLASAGAATGTAARSKTPRRSRSPLASAGAAGAATGTAARKPSTAKKFRRMTRKTRH